MYSPVACSVELSTSIVTVTVLDNSLLKIINSFTDPIFSLTIYVDLPKLNKAAINNNMQ